MLVRFSHNYCERAAKTSGVIRAKTRTGDFARALVQAINFARNQRQRVPGGQILSFLPGSPDFAGSVQLRPSAAVPATAETHDGTEGIMPVRGGGERKNALVKMRVETSRKSL